MASILKSPISAAKQGYLKTPTKGHHLFPNLTTRTSQRTYFWLRYEEGFTSGSARFLGSFAYANRATRRFPKGPRGSVSRIGYEDGLRQGLPFSGLPIINPIESKRQAIEISKIKGVKIQHLIRSSNPASLLLSKNDSIVGSENEDHLQGMRGNDVLDGGGSTYGDILEGGAGDDTYIIRNSRDEVIERADQGKDTIKSFVSIDKSPIINNIENFVLLGSDDIELNGNNSGNQLHGNNGKNTIRGYGGNDFILGGLNADRLIGGKGKDTFEYKNKLDSAITKKADQRDKIVDFNPAEGDLIDVSAIDADETQAGNQAFSYIGSSAFSGQPGEIRFSNGILQANVNFDTKAELEILLLGNISIIESTSFLL